MKLSCIFPQQMLLERLRVRQVTAGFSPLLRKLTSKQTDNLLVPGLELSSKAVAKKRLEAFSIS